MLFLFSGLLGIGLARVLMRMALLMLPPLPTSIVVPLTLDWRVLLFALSLSVGVGRGLRRAAGIQGLERDAGASLKDGVRSSSGRSRLRSAFVVGQIACSVLLVVLAALFVRVLTPCRRRRSRFRSARRRRRHARLVGDRGDEIARRLRSGGR